MSYKVLFLAAIGWWQRWYANLLNCENCKCRIVMRTCCDIVNGLFLLQAIGCCAILCVWFILWGGSDRNSFTYNSIVAYKMEHLNKIILIPKHNNSSNIIMITSISCLKRIKEHVFWFVANNSCMLLPYRNGSFFYSFRYMHKFIYLKRTHAEWIVESFG